MLYEILFFIYCVKFVSSRKTVHHSIINPDWDFQNMGVGGLDTEFNAIFRRAFASRVFPPEIVEQLGKMKICVWVFFYYRSIMILLFRLQTCQRYSSLWSTWNGKNSNGSSDRENVECP